MNLPKEATTVEVGPRDCFQMEGKFIPTEQKIDIVNALIGTGLRHFEVTSLILPKAIPQMRDAAQVAAEVKRASSLRLAALVPNLWGAENTADAGIEEVVGRSLLGLVKKSGPRLRLHKNL